MRRETTGVWCVLIVAAMAVLSTGGHAASRGEVLNRLEDFRRFFVDFQMAPDSAVPGDLLAECHGVIIMRQYKAGFVIGVKGGDGVIFLHDRATGAWSAPAFIATAEGSFGFQIGGQSIDAIMLIMNREGVDMLLKSRFQIGVDAAAAAGPVGRDAAAKVGPGTAILAYSRAKGLYAGVSFEGGAFLNHDEFNRAFYGMDIGIADILINGMVPVPAEAYPMIETLQSYADAGVVQPTPITVQAPAPMTIGDPLPAPRSDPRPSPIAPPPLPEPGPSVAPVSPSPEQAALEAAAADAARAAQAAAEAARRAQEAADAAARAAGAGR